MSATTHLYLTVFSPDGHLRQVEHAFKAVKQAEVTAIGVKGKNSVAIAVQKKVTDKLIDPSTVTHVYKITETVGACLVGLNPDVHYVCRRLRYEAAQFKFKNGFQIPASVLAGRLSQIHQLESQYVSLRPTAVSALIFGIEESNGDFTLYKVDPSGFSSGYRAVSCGVKEEEAMSSLEKKIADFETPKETVEFAISTLQTVVESDFEAKNIEVVLLSKEHPEFSVMKDEEVDAILAELAEKD